MDTEAYYYGGQGQGVCYDFPDEETCDDKGCRAGACVWSSLWESTYLA